MNILLQINMTQSTKPSLQMRREPYQDEPKERNIFLQFILRAMREPERESKRVNE